MMLTYQKLLYLFLLFCLTISIGCHKPATSQNAIPAQEKKGEPKMPSWLQRRITDFEEAKPTNPPVKIYRYVYKDQQVYYITGRCCDIPSEVTDSTGKQLCQPDGGITGRGDGKCTDFFATRTEEELIWEDLRK